MNAPLPPAKTPTRRTFLKWLGLAGGASLALPALAACTPAAPTTPAAPAAGKSGAQAPATTGAASALRIGYLPITDAAPLLVAHGQGYYQEQGLQPEAPTLFRGWAQIAEAFQARQLDIAHLLMPMTVWTRFGQQFPLKVVAWDHVDGSGLTVANDVQALDDLAGTTVAVPFWYSIHNVVLQLLMREKGLTPILRGEASREARTVKLVVMGPPDMPPALEQGTIKGYIVADPFNAAAEVAGIGKILRHTGDVWLNHACCVVVAHEEDTQRRPEWMQSVVTAVAQAQRFTRDNRVEAARLLSRDGQNYLPQPRPVIERALTHYDHAEYTATGAIQHPDWGNARIDFQPFPYPTYTQELVRLLKNTTVDGDASFLQALDPQQAHQQLVDDRFARAAIEAVGGPGVFGVSADLQRTEKISA